MAVNRFRIYRFVSLLLICFMIISWSSMTMAFTDTEGHWAEEAIDRWSEDYEIFLGSDGLFRPNADITRAEMAVLLDRMLGYVELSDFLFSDVSSDAWYAESISKLHTAGVMLGDGFSANPTANITREQAVTMLARAFSIDTHNGFSSALAYEDYGEISDWAIDAVGAMTAAGYIQGNEGYFSPKENLTRAEAVTIFDHMISGIFSQGGVYTEYKSGNVLVNAQTPVVFRDMSIEGDLYIAYHVEVPVTLDNVTIHGEIVNYSGIEPVRFGGSQESEEDITGDYITYGSYQVEILEDVPRNPYDDNLFFTGEDGRTYYASADYEVLTGIDVSAWQEDIDWQLVAQQDIDYVMLRVGYRGYTEGNIRLDPYFYQNIEKDGKTGYVGIRQEGEKYFVKIVYNYAKIEAYVSENQISSTISYAMILLNSIRYNDTLIDRIVNDTSVNSSEITYEIDKPSGSESKFSQYLSEYVQEEDDDNDVVLPDEYENE